MPLRKDYLKFSSIIVVSTFIFFHFFSSVCFAASANLKLSVLLDKNEYKAEEPINISFKLENKGKGPVYVNKRFYINSQDLPLEKRGEVILEVTSASGKKLPCKFSYETGIPKSDYFELLGPGEEVTSEYPRNLRGYFDLNEPGDYKIVAVYENVYGQEIGLDAFKDKVISSPVHFKIIKTGSADAKAETK